MLLETEKKSSNYKPEKDEKSFSYDDVLEHIGQLGHYQLRTLFLLLLPCLFFGLTILSYTFLGGIPQYRCRVNGCDPDRTVDANLLPEWLNHTIPWSDDKPKLVRQCQRFNLSWTDSDQCLTKDIDYEGVQTLQCDSGWIYDLSNFHSSIVTEFELTCEEEWKHTLSNTLFLVGMLVGALVLGKLADRIGRRKSFTINFALLAVFSTACAFSTDFWMFTIMRFFCGVFNIGYFLNAFTWGVEAVGQKYRTVCGYLLTGSTSTGSIFLGLIAYYVRDWRNLQLVLSIPMFPLLIIPWILPESTRWLLSKKRYDEAKTLILKAASVNGKSLPDHIMEKLEAQSLTQSTNDDEKSNPQESLLSVFSSPVLCKRVVILFVAWMGTNMGYYGITFSATNLSGDFYLNFILSVIVEPPAKIISVLIMDLLSRRTIFCGGLITSGLFCLATGLVPSEPTYLRLVMAIAGKFFVSASLGLIYLYTSEMFPTSTRSAVLGMCATMSKVGSMVAPSLAELGRNVNPVMPYIIFSIVNISVGFLCLLLPETGKVDLPSTLQDAINLEKYTITRTCCKREEAIRHELKIKPGLP